MAREAGIATAKRPGLEEIRSRLRNSRADAKLSLDRLSRGCAEDDETSGDQRCIRIRAAGNLVDWVDKRETEKQQ